MEVDAAPHVIEDKIGLQLVAPDENWRDRPDMHPLGTRSYRASIVARARFIEDLVIEQSNHGITQYVILGAGLDTFAQRLPEIASRLQVFEIDQPGTQAWKRQRLLELGFGIPAWLHLVSVDFEENESWWEKLIVAGFDASQPAVVAATGVSMYLTEDANKDMLYQIARFAPGSTLAMTFMLSLELIDAEERQKLQAVFEGARAAGTPFLSFFSPPEMLKLAQEAGFRKVQHVSTDELTHRYFSNRTDGLRSAGGEDFLVATS